ncbi:MAG: hypothetical protein WA713_14505 [Candidatus Acidiferrales bacterium]
MNQSAQLGTLFGRKEELRQLRAAIQHRESRLVCGPMDAGKTSLIQAAITELCEPERRNCFCWSGPATGRELVSFLLRGIYLTGDSFVRRKIQADGTAPDSVDRWLARQSALRLRGILFTACEKGAYQFFLDHFPPPTHNMARLLKDIMYRCRTPIYLAARGFGQGDVGYAWSLYWNDALRIHLGPLPDRAARELLESCIQKFGLASLHLRGFREEILHLSAHLPGSIVKMCALAAGSRYRYGDQIKTKLVHVDYLLRSNAAVVSHSQNFFQ